VSQAAQVTSMEMITCLSPYCALNEYLFNGMLVYLIVQHYNPTHVGTSICLNHAVLHVFG